jgi:hypothetical protein
MAKPTVTTSIDECGVKLVDPDKVGQVAMAMPQEVDVVDLADVFALLGEPGGCGCWWRCWRPASCASVT